MCTHCFDKNVYSFPTLESFEQFQNIIAGKVAGGTLENDSLPADVQGDMHGAELSLYEPMTAYKCSSCGETWYLSEPEHAWRGYFVTRLSLKPYLSRLIRSNRKNEMVGVVVVTGLALLILLLLFTC